MKPYIQKQPKQIKERIEAKLDERLVAKLEKYCRYLDSDRDYVISQALEIAFRRDKAFSEWLAAQGAVPDAAPVNGAAPPAKRGRKTNPASAHAEDAAGEASSPVFESSGPVLGAGRS